MSAAHQATIATQQRKTAIAQNATHREAKMSSVVYKKEGRIKTIGEIIIKTIVCF